MQTSTKTFDESKLYPSTKKQIKKTTKRVFRAIFKNPEGQVICERKYHGTKPRQAAAKAFSKILKIFSNAGIDLNYQIHFGLKECTRKAKVKKCFWYTGIKSQLAKPEKSRIKKNLSTGKPYLNPETMKPVIDPVSGKEVIDPKTCLPLLDSSGNPIIIFHKFKNIVKKSKSIYCKELLKYNQTKNTKLFESDSDSEDLNDDI